MTKSPISMRCAATWRAPMNMIMAPTIPIRTVEASVITESVVMDCRTLFNSRCAPAANTLGFAILRVVTLDNSHAPKRLGQPSGYFRRDLAAFAKYRSHSLKSALQNQPEGNNDHQHQRSHHGACAKQDRRANQGC